MANLIWLFVSIIAVAGAQEKQSPQIKCTPIISSKVVLDVAALMYDVSDVVYASVFEPHVSKHGPKVKAAYDSLQAHVEKNAPGVKAVLEEHMETALTKTGMSKVDVIEKYETIKMKKAVLQKDLESGWTTMKGKLNAITAKHVAKFDAAIPRHAGALPDTFGDFLIFVVYVILCCYVVQRILRKCFAIALCLFCNICCCRCICGGRKAKKVADGKKAEKPDGKPKANAGKSDKNEKSERADSKPKVNAGSEKTKKRK